MPTGKQKDKARPRNAAGLRLARKRATIANYIAGRTSGHNVPAKIRRQVEDARSGDVYAVNLKGRDRFRNGKGQWVRADIAATTKGGAKRLLQVKGGTKKVALTGPKAKAYRLPRGTDLVRRLDTRGQSLSRIAESNAVEGVATFVNWQGTVYQVEPDKGARLSDVFRVIVADYVADFSAFVDYPEFTVAHYETDEGDLIDMDDVALFPDGLTEELEGDPEAERAAQRFWLHVERQMFTLFPKRNATKKAVENTVRARRGTSPRRKVGKGRRKR